MGGGSTSVHAGIPPSRETPLQGDPPPQGIRSRPTAKGEIEGDQIQANTQGEIEGDQIQAHTQGGNWGGSDPGPHPRGKLRGIRPRPPQLRLLLRAVRILLECILVYKIACLFIEETFLNTIKSMAWSIFQYLPHRGLNQSSRNCRCFPLTLTRAFIT